MSQRPRQDMLSQSDLRLKREAVAQQEAEWKSARFLQRFSNADASESGDERREGNGTLTTELMPDSDGNEVPPAATLTTELMPDSDEDEVPPAATLTTELMPDSDEDEVPPAATLTTELMPDSDADSDDPLPVRCSNLLPDSDCDDNEAVSHTTPTLTNKEFLVEQSHEEAERDDLAEDIRVTRTLTRT